MTWMLSLPMLPASMNQRERQSFWIRKRELDEITRTIGLLAFEQKIPPALGRRSVQVTIHKSKRSRVKDDPANRDSRAKAILDAMVRTGLLVDDSDQWLDWGGVIEGEKRSDKQTVITLGEA